MSTTISKRLGRTVLYTLSEGDANAIIQRRRSAGLATFSGNDPRRGDTYPAIIVRDFAPSDEYPYSSCNLQVFLDGTDTYWPTSRSLFNPDVNGNFDDEWAGITFPEGVTDEEIAAERAKHWLPNPEHHFTYIDA